MKQIQFNSKREKYLNAFFWLRLLAFIVDIIIIKYTLVPILLLIFSFLISLFGVNIEGLLKNQFDGIKIVSSFIIWTYFFSYILYCSILESSKLRSTLGKYFFRFIVTDLKENKISFIRAFTRNLLKLLSFVTLGFGFFLIDLTKKKQSLHDLMIKTLVKRR